MISREKIEAVLSTIKAGSEYSLLVKGLKNIGILKYEHDVKNGLNIYYGSDNTVEIKNDQPVIIVNDKPSLRLLQYSLKIHQEGKIDYIAFCLQAAGAGVAKWISDLEKMKVIYIDRNNQVIYEEPILVSDNK